MSNHRHDSTYVGSRQHLVWHPWFGSQAFLWPALIAATAAEINSAIAGELAQLAMRRQSNSNFGEPLWATPNEIALELPSMRLREFSPASGGPAALIVAPFALHYSNVVDFARGHSLVAAVQNAGRSRVFVTDWRTATPEMRFFAIDNYLADINVAVDELSGPVDLIGLCQGGWMALIYAARFPGKIRKLVLVGAPVDVSAGNSALTGLASNVPLCVYKNFVAFGNGRMPGQCLLEIWGPWRPDTEGIRHALQLPAGTGADRVCTLTTRFRDWYETTVDLPGTYYLQVVEWLFKENRVALGQFNALGRRIDLATVRIPIFLLAARDDELIPPDQIFAVERHVGTSPRDLNKVVAPGGHLGLFMGARTLAQVWPNVVHWLGNDRT
jgi:poly(3-hydroxybutyrate) depolymerase